MKIQPGKLDQLVSLDRPTGELETTYGSDRERYEFVETVAAGIHGMGSKELNWAGQAGSAATHEVTIRRYPGMKPTWRLRWVDRDAVERVLNIESILDDNPREDGIVLRCVEQVAV